MPLFIFTIFISAFLLFQVQPIVARYILPWYGGSPAVWTTCMLFFQIGLLAGYGYAHWLATKFRTKRKWQLVIHLGLLLLAFALFLPITPKTELRPTGSEVSSVWSVVELLARTVGLPYLVMAASGPLLQHWFSGAYPGKSPYRLYAVSNIGSLLGLLSYPFLFQPNLGLKHQTWSWSGCFVFYGIIALLCAWVYCSKSEPEKESAEAEDTEAKPSLLKKLLWITLSALGSASLLSITNQMSQDISVTPYLWVLPLALYLITFIINFDRALWYQRLIWLPLMFVSIYLLGSLINSELGYHPYFMLIFVGVVCLTFLTVTVFKHSAKKAPPILIGSIIAAISIAFLNIELVKQFQPEEIHIYWQLGIFMATIFTTCMVCHGELVRLKPGSRYLTGFYLYMSFGGALGGILISLIAPKIFTGYWELHFLMISISLISGIIIALQFRQSNERIMGVLATIGLTLILAPSYIKDYIDTQDLIVESRRSFHGVVKVYEEYADSPSHLRSMYHGQICHGLQYLREDLRNQPNTYYTAGTGVGATMACVAQRVAKPRQPMKLGVIGLGSGTLATYAKPNDEIVFYEINDQVLDLANEYFTYLEECAGKASVKIGDARTTMEQQLSAGDSQQFDILFIDAFSGDSIPIHLVTQEAFKVYFDHLKPDGTIVAHITNLHIDLSDPIRQLATKFEKQCFLVENDPFDDYYSEWAIITDNKTLIKNLIDDNWITPWIEEKPDEIHWTDDYSNLLDVIIPLDLSNEQENRLE